MICLKCSGFSIFEIIFNFTGWRCFNCGKRVFYEEECIKYTEFDYFFRNKKTEQVPEQKPRLLLDIRLCIHCNVEFQCKTTHQIYCSSECRITVQNTPKKIEDKICIVCNETFRAKYKNRIYCSGKCNSISSNMIKSKNRSNHV